jgi:hypothetical protein
MMVAKSNGEDENERSEGSGNASGGLGEATERKTRNGFWVSGSPNGVRNIPMHEMMRLWEEI